jgi:hypothetical protein
MLNLGFHSRLPLVVFGAFLSVFCPDAAAEVRKTVSRVQIDMGGWVLVPTQQDTRVESVVALRTSGLAGSNIAAVWFKRGANNTWRVLAWQSQDLCSAVSYVKQSLAIPNEQDPSWPISGPFNTQNPTAPVAFSNGLFANDPMRLTVENSAHPKELLQDLVTAGYAAAVIDAELVDLTEACSESDVLQAIAQGVELELAQGPTSAGAGEEFAAEELLDLCVCIPWTWTISGPTLTGCTCTWPPIGIAACEWLGIHCAVVCHFDGTSTCNYTRTRKRRKWDCTTCTWVENGTKTGPVECVSTEYFLDPCVNPMPAYVPPASPDCDCPEPGGGITWTGNPPC